jgi:subtilisin family serine protease
MDARIRRDCRRIQTHRIRQLATTSTRENEVAVIAKVKDFERFKALVKDRRGRVVTLVHCPNDASTAIVTARIPGSEQEIESLRIQDCVISLKAARRLRAFLERTAEETFACSDFQPVDRMETSGKGVVIGIVDFGLDFVHRNFRDEQGETRILALWDQKASPARARSQPFGYGRLIERDEINDALKLEDPYEALGYLVPKDSLYDTGAHGTYVADVAAGNGLGSNCPGLAPEAGIVFVDLSTAGTALQVPQAVGSTFGDSVQLFEAIQFIFDYAQDRPCVINVSLGTNGGPHDGTTPLEQAIDWLVTEKPNRSVVIAAGNSFGKALHARGEVPRGGSVDLNWRIPRFDQTGNELEVWYEGADRFTVELRDPHGKFVARVKPDRIWEEPSGSKRLITIVNRTKDPNNGDNMINIFFDRDVPGGTWTVRLHGDSVTDGRFNAWIERDESGQSRFVKPTDESGESRIVKLNDKSYVISNECTLNSIACGHKTIVVGSYDANQPDRPLSESSSSGPTRDSDKRGRKEQQPTLSAPGENVLAAHSGTVVRRHRQSGTSMAAAAVTGIVSLMLSEAHARGIKLESHVIREILMDAVHEDHSRQAGWHAELGFGRVSASAAVTKVRELPGCQSANPTA